MKRRDDHPEVILEYYPASDAESRLQAAFDMILSKAGAAEDPQPRDLTENNAGHIMHHDHHC